MNTLPRQISIYKVQSDVVIMGFKRLLKLKLISSTTTCFIKFDISKALYSGIGSKFASPLHA
jgi:hypothetical protein